MSNPSRILALAAACALSATADAGKPAWTEAQVEQYLADKPADLSPLYRALFIEGEHNAVLNLDRIGLAALQGGRYDLAERAFDGALARIEQVFANDSQAQKAKSKFASEAVKDFKGEPYERSMAYYYRGLLFLRAGDYENARASFMSGEFQDTVSEKEQFTGDFDALTWLAGWSSHCAGDQSKAGEFFSRVSASLPRPAPEHNLLVLADVGLGPVKQGTGKHREMLEFRPNSLSTEIGAQYSEALGTNSRSLAGQTMTDLNWQATTRGGRPIQALLNGKAQWKSVTAGAADVLATTQMITMQQAAMSTDMAQSTDLYNASAVAGVIGLFASLAADAMKPAADIRFWETLPQGVHVGSSVKPADLDNLRVSFTGAPADAPGLAMVADPGRCAIAWSRSRSALPPAGSAPNTQLSASDLRKSTKANGAKDAAFRAALLDGTL